MRADETEFKPGQLWLARRERYDCLILLLYPTKCSMFSERYPFMAQEVTTYRNAGVKEKSFTLIRTVHAITLTRPLIGHATFKLIGDAQ